VPLWAGALPLKPPPFASIIGVVAAATTLHLPFFAPTGRRTVATGGAPAARQRAVRNPWKRSCFNPPASRGQRKHRAQAVKSAECRTRQRGQAGRSRSAE
jgi:hypothetical protein